MTRQKSKEGVHVHIDVGFSLFLRPTMAWVVVYARFIFVT
jgi:hypothetical protein